MIYKKGGCCGGVYFGAGLLVASILPYKCVLVIASLVLITASFILCRR